MNNLFAEGNDLKTIWLTFLLVAGALRAADAPDPRTEIAELRLKNGTTLHHVQIVSFSTTAAMARWDEGRGTIAYENFPEEWQGALLKFRPEQSRAPTNPSPHHRSNFLSQFPPVDMAPMESLPAQPGERQIVSGQCFVVTKGGVNIKMGLVEVSIYPLQAFTSYSAEIQRRSAARFEAMKRIASPKNFTQLDLDAMQRSLEVGKVYFAEKHAIWSLLPMPPASTKTDADGRFSMTHNVAPPYVIFARGSRKVGDDNERYVWRVTSDKIQNPAQVFLSNDNME